MVQEGVSKILQDLGYKWQRGWYSRVWEDYASGLRGKWLEGRGVGGVASKGQKCGKSGREIAHSARISHAIRAVTTPACRAGSETPKPRSTEQGV